MNVKKDASGRRYVETEIEVSGTPEEVWKAIASGPGISSWFVPTEFKENDGKPVSVHLSFGPGMEIVSEVTAWNPPRSYATKAGLPRSPALANEWSVEARDGGICIVRIVQSLFASTDDWDDQLESAKSGLASFLCILQIYLRHFRGQRSSMMKWMVPVAGTEAEAWESLTEALGIKGLSVGDHCVAASGVPSFSGEVEYVTLSPFDALLRLDKPGPGVAAFGAVNFGGPSMVAMNFYLYGDEADGIIAQETPHWQAWFQERFPIPEASNEAS